MAGIGDQTGVQIIEGPGNAGGEVKFLPLKEVFIDVEIQESIAVMKMIQEYHNPGPAKEGELAQP